MLTFDEIKELIELVASRRLGGLEIERAGFRFKIDGHEASPPPMASVAPAGVPVAVAPAAPAPAPAPPAPAPVAAPPAAPAEESDEAELPDGHRLTSPIVGTFYTAPSPDDPPFVKAGDSVRKGQVLCIVEAMKLMNEIESDVDGVVVEVLPQNGQPVEYGEPLFVIKT